MVVVSCALGLLLVVLRSIVVALLHFVTVIKVVVVAVLSRPNAC
jgi:hypothetical protein